MRARTIWSRKLKNESRRATISIHITGAERRERNGITFINPYRIGMDFDGFGNYSQHDYIPNFSLADLVQLVNLLEQVGRRRTRFLRKRKLGSTGLELESRRRIDFDITKNDYTGDEELKIYYEDKSRKLDRFYCGSIEAEKISDFVKMIKEAVLEYVHMIQKWMNLGEIEWAEKTGQLKRY